MLIHPPFDNGFEDQVPDRKPPILFFNRNMSKI